MKIKEIKINSYGNIKDAEIKLKNNINIISGNNESGKSTLFNFILSSFYGISKNKKGKEISDLERYKPWDSEEFSGKIIYELDNNEQFEVYRDFKKKNPKIFNENMEDVSKNFNIDKNKGNEFFYEQTKIDEELFLSTLVVNQQEVKLEKQEQNILIQKIANLVGTGEDNVSYKRAIDRINRRQLDEVGTLKSREKPINIVMKKMEELEKEKVEIEKYEEIKYEIEEDKSKIKNNIFELEEEENCLKELKILIENEKIGNEKVNIKQEMRNKNIQKIEELDNKISEIELIIKEELQKNAKENNQKNNKNKMKVINNLILIVLILMNILQIIFIKNAIVTGIGVVCFIAYTLYYILYNKNNKEKIQKIKNEQFEKQEKTIAEKKNLINQKELLEKEKNELEEEINKLKNDFNIKINVEKDKIKNKYINKISDEKIENLIKLENVNYELQILQNQINNLKIKLHTLEIDKNNIEPKLEKLANIEEEYTRLFEKRKTLEMLDKSINLAKEFLEKAYIKMKTSVTPKFAQNLSEIILKITDGKYKKVMLNDEKGLIVELKNGNYESVSKLSVGTIDQLYLALRLSMIEELSKEKMPIILDEVFAYYDTERLINILKYIRERFKDHQVIIFTCTSRETEILEKENIEFNLVEL